MQNEKPNNMSSTEQNERAGYDPWRGPRYLRAARHRGDLIFVLRHLAAILGANASITGGLAASVEDARARGVSVNFMQRKVQSYALITVAVLAWSVFPAWEYIEPSRDPIFNNIALVMLAIELVALVLLGWRAWPRRKSVSENVDTSDLRRRRIALGNKLDLALLILVLGAALLLFLAMAIVANEYYFGILGALSVMLINTAFVLRIRKLGMPRGPVTRTLSTRTTAGNKRIALMQGLGEALQDGATLGEAMDELNNFFPAHVAGRIRAAEQTGRLSEAMHAVIDELEVESKSRGKRAGTYFYLATVLFLQILVITFIFIKILPVFASILEEFGAELPHSAKRLLGLGDFFLYKWPNVVTLTAFGTIAVITAYRHLPGAKLLWARLLLSLPVVGAVQRFKNAARVSRMLGDLLESGVPLHEALELCASAGIGPAHATLLRTWMPLAVNGESLAGCASAHPTPSVMPTGFAAAAQLGEGIGAPRDALHHAADHYQECAQRAAVVADAMTYPILLAPLALITYMVTTAIYAMLAGTSDALFYSL